MKKMIAVFLVLVGLVVGGDELAQARRLKEDTPTLRQIEAVGRKRGASESVIRMVKTIACKESRCGRNPVPFREESRDWEAKARKVARNKKEFEAYMHSYGSLQLSGIYTYLDYGKKPHEIIDDDIGIEIGFEKAERLAKRCNGSSYCTYFRWNGTGKRAQKYARIAMQIEATV